MAQVKKSTRKEKESEPLREDLKIRVMEARKKLPTSGVTSFFLKLYPEYDNVKKRSLLGNVLQGRSTDLDVTEKLEKMVIIIESNVITED